MGDERPGHDHAEASGDPPGEGDNPLGDPPGIERQPGQRPDAEENAPSMRQPPGDDVYDNPLTGPESRGGRHSLRRRPKRRKAKAPWWELPVLVGVAIVVAVLIKTFLIQPFYIPSQSMERTLHGCAGCSGDRILVNKPIYYLRDPHPGDIVVFRAPTDVWFNEPLPELPIL